jgi:hypothetical protein
MMETAIPMMRVQIPAKLQVVEMALSELVWKLVMTETATTMTPVQTHAQQHGVEMELSGQV